MERDSKLSVLEGPSSPIPDALQLHQIFQRNIQKLNLCKEIALIFEDTENGRTTELTYGTLEAKSNQLARRMYQILESADRKRANSDGDCVITVCLEPSQRLITTLLAVWKLGAAYLPLDVNTPVSRMEHISKEVNPLLLITDQKVETSQNAIQYSLLEAESSTLSSDALDQSERLQSESASPVAIILYTSGSTGVPKGVRLPHKVILNRLSWQWRTFPFDKNEAICVFKTAITFVDAVSEIWAPLLYAEPRTLLVLPKHATKDTEKLLQVLNTFEVRRLILVPSLLQAILMYVDMTSKRTNEDFLAGLTLWICSGEPLPVALVQRFFSRFADGERKLCNFYGSTEIMGDVSYYTVNSAQQLRFEDKIPIGIPLNNTALYLLDDNFEMVERGKIGELFVAGYNLAAGYVAGRDPDRFIRNPFCSECGFDRLYRTGDFAKIVDDVLLYEGRCDSQIKIRGQRVDLSEIQAALNNLPAVAKSAVLCYKPGDISQAIVAFVTLNKGCSLSARQIQDRLKKILVSYAVPQVLLTDSIPLLNNGKVDRQKLLQLYAKNSEIVAHNPLKEIDYKGIESGKMKAARYLFETITSVLGDSIQQGLSASTNFYDIGGNSLNCILTITKLRERGYFISIADFITAPNLGAIVHRMQPEKHAKENIPNEGDVKKIKNFNKTNYKYEMLKEKHKDVVFKIITDSFYEKADLEQWLVPKPGREHYHELLDAIWHPLVEKNLSFVVYSESESKYVGACLNFDTYDEPEVVIQSNLTIIFEFLEFLEEPARKKLPAGKRKILHSFMMGTDASLNAAQNIQVVTCMESEIIRAAKRKNFIGVFTTNTNPLTQQLGTDVYKYRTLLDYQVNEYVAPDGSKPFAEAPDEQKAVCCWKPISDNHC